MFDRLKARLDALDETAALLDQVQQLQVALARCADAMERVAGALELQNAHAYPQQVQATPDTPAVTVSYVDDREQAEMADIELRLTAARGMPPTEEEILEELLRRHPPEPQ